MLKIEFTWLLCCWGKGRGGGHIVVAVILVFLFIPSWNIISVIGLFLVNENIRSEQKVHFVFVDYNLQRLNHKFRKEQSFVVARRRRKNLETYFCWLNRSIDSFFGTQQI